MSDNGAIVYLILIAGLVFWLMRVRTRVKDLTQRLEKEQRERKAVYRFLDGFGERVTQENLTLEPTLKIVTEFISDATEAEAAAAFLIDSEKNVLVAKVVYGTFPPLMQTTKYILTKQRYINQRIMNERIPLGEGIVGEVAFSGKPLLIKDAALDPRIPRVENPVVAIRSIMAAPLAIRGKVLGVLAVVNKRGIGVFSNEELDLLVSISDQAASTVELVKLYAEQAEKQRFEQELKVAHDFQQMLLPKACPEIPGYEIAAYSDPAEDVGGDYYDFIFIDEKKRYLGIAVADVSGKGIPGALIMAVVRCTMRATAPNNLSPRDVLMKVNDRVHKDTKENVFVTINYGILDTKEGIFRFVRAGHEPVVTVGRGDGQVQLSSPPGMAMGLVGSDLFGVLQEQSIPLRAGNTAIMYTDGVIEAMDSEQNEYGQQRFFDLVASAREDSPREIIEKTLRDIREFTKGYPQHDDITLLAIRVTGEKVDVENPTATMPYAGI